jgi:hypothetical protein
VKRAWIAPLADAAILVAFVGIGRRSHNEGSALDEFLRVLWPFAVGLVLAYAVTQLWRSPLDLPRAAVAWLVTVGVGETLRLAVQDRELKIGFLVVALIWFGALMVGWRYVVRRVTRRRRSRPAPAAPHG